MEQIKLYLLFLVVLTGIGYTIGRAIRAFATSRDADDSTVGAEVVDLFLYSVICITAVALVGHWFAPGQWTISGWVSDQNVAEPLATLLMGVPVLVSLSVGLSGIVLGVWPAMQRLSGASKTAWRKIPGIIGGLVVSYVLLGVAAHLLGSVGLPQIVGLGIIVAIPATVYFLLPHLLVFGRQPRDPTEEEQARITEACVELDIDVDDIVITEADAFKGAIWIVGRPGLRRLVILSSFLDAATDEELSVALAEADGRKRKVQKYMGLKSLAGVLFFGGLIYGFYFYPFLAEVQYMRIITPVMAVAVGGIALLSLWSNKMAYKVDVELSERFGVETVLETYERHGGTLFTSRAVPRWMEFSQLMPSAPSRIEHLRNRFENTDG